MSKPTTDEVSGQREALKDSERRSDLERPQNFKDKDTDEKIVEVLPIDGDSAPIKGIDPDPQKKSASP